MPVKFPQLSTVEGLFVFENGGIMSSVMFGQFDIAYDLIVVTLAGNVRLVIAEQPMNAVSPIYVTPSGNSNLSMLLQSEKQPELTILKGLTNVFQVTPVRSIQDWKQKAGSVVTRFELDISMSIIPLSLKQYTPNV